MIRICLYRARFIRVAILVSASMTLSSPAAAQPDDEYRERTEKLRTGVEVVQHASAAVFPRFEGRFLNPLDPELPAVKPGYLRSLRILMPLDDKRQATFAVRTRSTDDTLSGEVDTRTLRVVYRAPSFESDLNPFVVQDDNVRHVSKDDAHASWTQLISFPEPISSEATHVLFTVYVHPQFDDLQSPPRHGTLLLAANEATLQDMRLVTGKSLVDDVVLTVNDNEWHRWRHQPVRAGSRSILASIWPHGHSPFVEQRVLPFAGEPGSPRREKRCAEDWLATAYSMGSWLLERAFGAHSLCTLDPQPNMSPANRLPLIEIGAAPDDAPAVDLSSYEAAAFHAGTLDAEDGFDVAMDIVFCNDNHDPAAPASDVCTMADRDAAAAIGELSPAKIRELLDQMAGLGASSQETPTALRTGIARLDSWLNADWDRAHNALNAAMAIAHVSDAGQAPSQPIKKKAKNKKVLKASCANSKTVETDSDEPWQQCVRKAKQKAGVREPSVAIPPLIQATGSFHRRGTPQFDHLVRQFKNSGKGMPGGISGSQFAEFTTAIAIDTAHTGDNLGIVFLNDPALRPGGHARFRYGLNHIWAPGAGGGENAGHRGDWQALAGLPVNSQEMLVKLVMAALTDVHADYDQERSKNGNVVRDYRRYTVRYGADLYVVTNIRIVLAQNGMVITAYPRRGAKADRLNM